MFDEDGVSAASQPEKYGRPQSWNDWADFFSKTALAIASLGVTGIGAYVGHIENQRAQADSTYYHEQEVRQNQLNYLLERQNYILSTRNSDREQKIAERESINDVRGNIAVAMDKARANPNDPTIELYFRQASENCNDKNYLGYGTKALVSLCTQLAKIGTKIIATNGMAATAEANAAVIRQDPKAFLNSASAASQNTGLTASESRQAIESSARWFAVIASLPLNSGSAVHSLADQLNAKLMGAGLPPRDVHVYRTKISNSLALTSGTDKSQQEAQARVRMLKRAGFHDAFAQPDREWVRADNLR